MLSLLLYLIAFSKILTDSCVKDRTQCAGLGSLWNSTELKCVCGFGEKHMWGDSCEYGRIRYTYLLLHLDS